MFIVIYKRMHARLLIIMIVQDSILWIHILLQMFAFGIIFPTGMVLGVGDKDQGQYRGMLIRILDCAE